MLFAVINTVKNIFPVFQKFPLCYSKIPCFPCLEKVRTKFPVFPIPWPPCSTPGHISTYDYEQKFYKQKGYIYTCCSLMNFSLSYLSILHLRSASSSASSFSSSELNISCCVSSSSDNKNRRVFPTSTVHATPNKITIIQRFR